MIRSMTGFGQGSAEGAGLRITVELRGVNNRFADLRLKLPSEIAPMEGAIRRRLQEVVRRGRVEMRLILDRTEEAEVPVTLNRTLLRSLVAAARAVRSDYGIQGTLDLSTVLSMPGILQAHVPGRELDESERAVLDQALDAALERFDQERLREGKALREDLTGRVEVMAGLVARIREKAGQVPAAARKKLLERVQALAEGLEPDPARIAQEAAFLADRCDITEELVRLDGHVAQALKILSEPDGEPAGKRLDFLLQEIQREINTVCSKSADLDLSQIALELRSGAEKVREQLQNLE
jgi:uncharacterized protein (TIGR00255 family)